VTGEPLLAMRDLSVSFPVPSARRSRWPGLRRRGRDETTVGSDVAAVRGLDLTLGEREVLGVVGESGSGKSTAALAVLGLLPGTARVTGSITYRGRELVGLGDRELAAVRGRRVAMVLQDPFTALNPVHRVGAQIAEGLRAHQPGLGRRAARARAVELLELVGIPDPVGRADRYPHEFSGGMRQRVVIAMAVASDPEVLIADEPTTALDVTVQAQVLDALRTARAATGAAMLLITHDLGVVAGQADRVLVMYAGRAVETGSVEDVFLSPRMPYTLGLLGSSPRLDADRTVPLTPIAGAPPSAEDVLSGCPFAPRCPLASSRCRVEEPLLRPVDDRRDAGAGLAGAGVAKAGRAEVVHLAACHHAEQTEGRSPAELFEVGR
jgi:oligopeptide/dipeptide ABC transporter ATP-binding protein